MVKKSQCDIKFGVKDMTIKMEIGVIFFFSWDMYIETWYLLIVICIAGSFWPSRQHKLDIYFL